jgi:hypothetical protein
LLWAVAPIALSGLLHVGASRAQPSHSRLPAIDGQQTPRPEQIQTDYDWAGYAERARRTAEEKRRRDEEDQRQAADDYHRRNEEYKKRWAAEKAEEEAQKQKLLGATQAQQRAHDETRWKKIASKDDDKWADDAFYAPIGPGSSIAANKAYNRRVSNAPIVQTDLSAEIAVDECPTWINESSAAAKLKVALDELNGSALKQANDNEDALRIAREILTKYLPDRGQELRSISRVNVMQCLPGFEGTLVNEAFNLRKLAKQERDAGDPSATLVAAYRAYLATRRCYESREGASPVYVDPYEMEAITQQTSAIERKLLSMRPSLEKNELWRQANHPTPWQPDTSQQGIKLVYGQAAVEQHQYTSEGIYYCTSLRRRLAEISTALGLEAASTRPKDF